MNIIIFTFFKLVISIVECLEYALIGYIILGWLVLFGVIKRGDSPILKLYIFLMAKIEPVLVRVRHFVPPLFGLDFSAMVVFFALYLVKVVIMQIAYLLG